MINLKDKKILLFDLDGTLTDSALGITRGVQFALKSFGIEVEDAGTLRGFIGPPIRGSFTEYYGFDKEKAEKASAVYRTYYEKNGIIENTLYPGIPELLKSLKEQGKIMAVATTKPAVYAEKILERHNILQFFDFVSGSEISGARSDKKELIDYALYNLKLNSEKDKAAAVMIGDRKFDMIGAKEAGITALGVLYGYGSRDELKQSGADIIVNDMRELYKVLFGGKK